MFVVLKIFILQFIENSSFISYYLKITVKNNFSVTKFFESFSILILFLEKYKAILAISSKYI